MLYKEEIIVTLNSSNNFKNNKIYTSKSLIQFTLGLFNFSRLIFRILLCYIRLKIIIFQQNNSTNININSITRLCLLKTISPPILNRIVFLIFASYQIVYML